MQTFPDLCGRDMAFPTAPIPLLVVGRGVSPFPPTESPYSPFLLFIKAITTYQLIPPHPVLTKHKKDNSY